MHIFDVVTYSMMKPQVWLVDFAWLDLTLATWQIREPIPSQGSFIQPLMGCERHGKTQEVH